MILNSIKLMKLLTAEGKKIFKTFIINLSNFKKYTSSEIYFEFMSKINSCKIFNHEYINELIKNDSEDFKRIKSTQKEYLPKIMSEYYDLDIKLNMILDTNTNFNFVEICILRYLSYCEFKKKFKGNRTNPSLIPSMILSHNLKIYYGNCLIWSYLYMKYYDLIKYYHYLTCDYLFLPLFMMMISKIDTNTNYNTMEYFKLLINYQSGKIKMSKVKNIKSLKNKTGILITSEHSFDDLTDKRFNKPGFYHSVYVNNNCLYDPNFNIIQSIFDEKFPIETLDTLMFININSEPNYFEISNEKFKAMKINNIVNKSEIKEELKKLILKKNSKKYYIMIKNCDLYLNEWMIESINKNCINFS